MKTIKDRAANLSGMVTCTPSETINYLSMIDYSTSGAPQYDTSSYTLTSALSQV